MQDLPLKKLGGFGGKLGEQLAALGCSTAGQVGGAGVRCPEVMNSRLLMLCGALR